MNRFRAWAAALAKGAWARGEQLAHLVAFAELVEEPPRPPPGPARQVVVQPHELARSCPNCGTFHDVPSGKPVTVDGQFTR
jgi:hypothetical protein